MTPGVPSALELALACAGTYEASAVPQWEDPAKLIHVHLSQISGIPVLAFEGTTDFREWCVDFFALEIPFRDHLELGPLHAGLARGVFAVADQVWAWLRIQGLPQYVITGHSKGAGEALIAHAEFKRRGHAPVRTVAFEAPRVGGQILQDFLQSDPIVQTATQNSGGRDLVTQVPFGPTWRDPSDPLVLRVPDGLDIPAKHRIPAVIQALQAQGPT